MTLDSGSTKIELPAPLGRAFFERDALTVAPELAGCRIVRVLPSGEARILTITETEAYCGESDSACHARHGRTKRNEPFICAAASSTSTSATAYTG